MGWVVYYLGAAVKRTASDSLEVRAKWDVAAGGRCALSAQLLEVLALNPNLATLCSWGVAFPSPSPVRATQRTGKWKVAAFGRNAGKGPLDAGYCSFHPGISGHRPLAFSTQQWSKVGKVPVESPAVGAIQVLWFFLECICISLPNILVLNPILIPL